MGSNSQSEVPLHEQDRSVLILPSEPLSASRPANNPPPASSTQLAEAQQAPTTRSPANGDQSSSTRGRRTTHSNVFNLLTLTELRKAAWAHIYYRGIQAGDAAISTRRVPTWKEFDALMIRRHRYIAVDPRDNRTLGWVACFHPYPQWSHLYRDDELCSWKDPLNGRQGKIAEIQIMVAEAERRRGVGTFLLTSIVTSLEADSRYSVVQANLFEDDKVACRLFEKCRFEKVAKRTCAVRMLDGPRKGEWRHLITVEYELTPMHELE
ncbi:hypothetical protein [Sporisorium scitamineum]|uniref:N-acetyltransferase domain-containing protein n=1 Tax=Sporisorium scitamineum TaxID=49012 RepID=A0A0F7S5V3_9BASI|nr:hypothetical protein [Sporisorium scitamineum]